jgi:hypothetical protein
MKEDNGGVLSGWVKCLRSGEQKNENYFAPFKSCSVSNADNSGA